MSIAEIHQMAEILDRIKTWPIPSRITLARQILESVEATPEVEPPTKKRNLRELVGLLKTDAPPPTDEECRAILEEELIKKHLR